jgi:hypothetical protein
LKKTGFKSKKHEKNNEYTVFILFKSVGTH